MVLEQKFYGHKPVGGLIKHDLSSSFEDIFSYFYFNVNVSATTANFKINDVLSTTSAYLINSKDDALDGRDRDNNSTLITSTFTPVSLEILTKSLADKYSYDNDLLKKKIFLFMCYSTKFPLFTKTDEYGSPISFNSIGSSDKELLKQNEELNTTYLDSLKDFLSSVGDIDLETVSLKLKSLFPVEIYGNLNFSGWVHRILELITDSNEFAKDKGGIYVRMRNFIDKSCNENGKNPTALRYYDEHTKDNFAYFMTSSRKNLRRLGEVNAIQKIADFTNSSADQVRQLRSNIAEDRKEILINMTSSEDGEVEDDE